MKHYLSVLATLRRAAAFCIPVLLWTLPAADAQAYVDPGTGSMMLQMGAAAIAAGLFYLRSFRDWLKGLFRGKSLDDNRD